LCYCGSADISVRDALSIIHGLCIPFDLVNVRTAAEQALSAFGLEDVLEVLNLTYKPFNANRPQMTNNLRTECVRFIAANFAKLPILKIRQLNPAMAIDVLDAVYNYQTGSAPPSLASQSSFSSSVSPRSAQPPPPAVSQPPPPPRSTSSMPPPVLSSQASRDDIPPPPPPRNPSMSGAAFPPPPVSLPAPVLGNAPLSARDADDDKVESSSKKDKDKKKSKRFTSSSNLKSLK